MVQDMVLIIKSAGKNKHAATALIDKGLMMDLVGKVVKDLKSTKSTVFKDAAKMLQTWYYFSVLRDLSR